jgi:hypothetical protein
MRNPLALLLGAALLCAAASGFSSPIRGRYQPPGAQQQRAVGQVPDLSRVINTELTTGHPDGPRIMRIYVARPGEFDDVNLSTAWNRLGKSFVTLTASDRRKLFEQYQEQLLDMLVAVASLTPLPEPL